MGNIASTEMVRPRDTLSRSNEICFQSSSGCGAKTVDVLDPAFQETLFDRGYQMAPNGTVWHQVPLGVGLGPLW